jgi:hypothetical protein
MRSSAQRREAQTASTPERLSVCLYCSDVTLRVKTSFSSQQFLQARAEQARAAIGGYCTDACDDVARRVKFRSPCSGGLPRVSFPSSSLMLIVILIVIPDSDTYPSGVTSSQVYQADKHARVAANLALLGPRRGRYRAEFAQSLSHGQPLGLGWVAPQSSHGAKLNFIVTRLINYLNESTRYPLCLEGVP